MENTLIPLNTIIRLPRNPKDHDLGEIHQSIERFGFLQRVVINLTTNRLIAGHGRIDALQQMKAMGKPAPEGIEVNGDGWLVPADLVAVPEEEEEAASIALNRLTELGGWDDEALAAVLSDLAAQDLLAGTGFDEEDVDQRLRDLARSLAPPEAPEAQVDRAAELQERWQVQRGQVWEIPSKTVPGKSHKVMCGDSTCEEDVGRLMGGEKAGAVITDPPYGINIVGHSGHIGGGALAGVNFYEPIIGDDEPFDPAPFLNIAKNVAFFGANYYADKLPASPGWIVWDKREETTSDNHADCELIWTNQSNPARLYRQLWRGMIRRGEATIKMHPTQKPTRLFGWIIEQLTKIGQTVYDPFLGSGATIVACEQTGRIGYGMEICEKYVAVNLQRLADMGLTPQLADG